MGDLFKEVIVIITKIKLNISVKLYYCVINNRYIKIWYTIACQIISNLLFKNECEKTTCICQWYVSIIKSVQEIKLRKSNNCVQRNFNYMGLVKWVDVDS